MARRASARKGTPRRARCRQPACRRERGQGLVEYSLIISLIVIVAMITVDLLGQGVFSLYTGIGSSVADAFSH